MKIAILGKGTSAIITALTCIHRGYEVEIFYDPEKPQLSVGESTTPHIGELISKVFGISIGDLIDRNIVSLKYGIKFINWGEGTTFNHYFNTNSSAFHFESGIFNLFFHELLEKRGVKYHPIRVDGYTIDFENEKVIIHDMQYDHLISCSGWSDSDEYLEPIFKTVDSALLYSTEKIGSQPYTEHLATEDGWQFGLPFPERNLMKHGYLFNSNDISSKKIQEKLNKKDSKIISWNPKLSKKIIQNRFCSYNGNRLMFLEPLQALSLYYYLQYAEIICDFLSDRRHETYVRTNQTYHRYMFEYQLSLAWHYSYGSKYNSSFWERTKNESINLLKNNPKGNFELLKDAIHHDKKFNVNDIFKIGCFGYKDYIQVNTGMTQNEYTFEDSYVNIF